MPTTHVTSRMSLHYGFRVEILESSGVLAYGLTRMQAKEKQKLLYYVCLQKRIESEW